MKAESSSLRDIGIKSTQIYGEGLQRKDGSYDTMNFYGRGTGASTSRTLGKEEISMNPWTLEFLSKSVEQDYQDHLVRKLLPSWKVYVSLSTLLYNISYNLIAVFIYVWHWEDKHEEAFPCGPEDSVNRECINRNSQNLAVFETEMKEYQRCSLYVLPKNINNNLYFLGFGAALPYFIMQFVVYYYQRKKLPLTILPYLSTFYCLVTTIVNTILFNSYVAKTNCWMYETALPLILIMLLHHVFLRIRFLHSIFISVTVVITYIFTGIHIDRIQENYSYVATIMMCIALSTIIFMAYEQEKLNRRNFFTNRNLLQANNKLYHQLKGISVKHALEVADFESPLEKAISLLNSVTTNPNISDELLEMVQTATQYLTSTNLQAPNIVDQIEKGNLKLDADQENWLLTQITQKQTIKQRKPRKSMWDDPEHMDAMNQARALMAGAAVNSPTPEPTQLYGINYGGNLAAQHAAMSQLTGSLMDIIGEPLFISCGISLENLRKIQNMLQEVNSWNFPIFEFASLCKGWPLTVLCWNLFKTADLLETLNLNTEKFCKFIMKIEKGYRKDLSYHNSTHAADVLHAIHYFSQKEAFSCITDIDLLALYFAAAIHDHDHPGLGNNFLITTKSEKAILYNDKAVLENHHLATSFQIALQPEYNFFEGLSTEEYKTFRKIVVDMVLATDLSSHFGILGKFKTQTQDPDKFNLENNLDDKILLCQMAIKCADVSNPSKRWDIYEGWCKRILEEFFKQGDQEKALNMPISPFMDRDNVNIPSSQIGFIDFICLPIYEAFDNYVGISDLLSTARQNKERWVEEKIKSGQKTQIAGIVVHPPDHSHGGGGGHGTMQKTHLLGIQEVAEGRKGSGGNATQLSAISIRH